MASERLPKTGDHVDARVPQSAGNQSDTTIMANRPQFPQQHAGPVEEVCSGLFFQRVVGSFVARMLNLRCPVFRHRTARPRPRRPSLRDDRSDWAMKMRTHCSITVQAPDLWPREDREAPM